MNHPLQAEELARKAQSTKTLQHEAGTLQKVLQKAGLRVGKGCKDGEAGVCYISLYAICTRTHHIMLYIYIWLA